MTDTSMEMNPLHFGSDLADTWIKISPEMQIQIPDHFWFSLDALAEMLPLSDVWLLLLMPDLFPYYFLQGHLM